MTNINEKIENYLNERKPTLKDYDIKDLALALTGEIETSIENIVKEWEGWGRKGWSGDEYIGSEGMAKVINLAIKNISRNKVVRNCIPR